jgi:hypothetical protein
VKFPPHFHGSWFVGDFNTSWIDALQLNAAADSVRARMKVFGASATSLTNGYLDTLGAMSTNNSFLEMEMGPDGALYVLHYGGYRTNSAATGIFRVEYRGTCRPTSVPVAFHRERSGAELARLRGMRLEVSSVGTHRVQVRDLSGKIVWSREGSGNVQYDLRGSISRPAVHFLTVTAKGESFVRRLMP